jgi:hypothetical protein
VLQEFELEKLTVREREVGCSPVVREFEFVFLTVGNSPTKERTATTERTKVRSNTAEAGECWLCRQTGTAVQRRR